MGCTCNMVYNPNTGDWSHHSSCPLYPNSYWVPYPSPFEQDKETNAALERLKYALNRKKTDEEEQKPNPGKCREEGYETKPAMQSFTTGATRSDDSYKPDFEGFFSPLVLGAYAEYMQEHRIQDDGNVRASDNWQKGMPFHKYIKSLWRHFHQLWLLHRGYTPAPEKRAGKVVPVTMISALSGIMFNTMGYFHEYLMDRDAWVKRVVSEPENGDKITALDARRQKVA
jgi:hypothetical protein